MYLISTIATILLGTVLSAPTAEVTRDLARTYFTCNSTSASGYSAQCCTDINGQVGINCKTQHTYTTLLLFLDYCSTPTTSDMLRLRVESHA